MSRQIAACFSLLFIMMLTGGKVAEAAAVQFTLVATVAQDGGGMLPGISEGDVIAGAFGFDVSVLPFMQDDSQALYSDAFTGFSFALGTQVISLDSIEPSIVGVTNGAQDFLVVDQVVSSILLGDFRATGFSIRFADFEGLAFDNTALPTSLNIDDFDIRFISVEFFSAINGPVALVLEVDTIQAVPVPAALWMLSSGLLVLLRAHFVARIEPETD